MTRPEHTPASTEEHKHPLAPDVSRLAPRAARAWTERMAVTPLGNGRYAVESASGSRYAVDLLDGACTCPDHDFRGERCKHLRRVSIEITRNVTPPPGRRRGRCRDCEREAFVTEADPPLCPDCELAAGDPARDREAGDLVVIARIADERADERPVPDAGCTVADYGPNAAYPADDRVIEVVYPGSGSADTPRAELPRYAFPRSRLAALGERERDRARVRPRHHRG